MKRKPSHVVPVRSPRLHYHEVPGVWAQLQMRPEIAARALQLIILSACRSTEVVHARWGGIDWPNQVWTIPAADMKSARDHSVPVVPAMAVLLGGLRGLSLEWVIPRGRLDHPIPSVRLISLLRSVGCHGITPYVFRRCFYDWAIAQVDYQEDVVNRALAHDALLLPSDPGLWADLLNQQRRLIHAWSVYCLADSPLAHFAEG